MTPTMRQTEMLNISKLHGYARKQTRTAADGDGSPMKKGRERANRTSASGPVIVKAAHLRFAILSGSFPFSYHEGAKADILRGRPGELEPRSG